MSKWLRYFILAFVVFNALVAFTVEGWWVLHATEIRSLAASGSTLAKAYLFYAVADPTYAAGGFLERFLEGTNVFVTTPLLLFIGYNLWKRGHAWEKLGLAVGSYLTYSVVLYYVEAVGRAGYPGGWPAVAFWLSNALWLAGGALLSYAAWKELV